MDFDMEMPEFIAVYAIMIASAAICSFILLLCEVELFMMLIPFGIVILNGIVFLGAFLIFSISEFRYNRKCNNIEYESYIIQKAKDQLIAEGWTKNGKTD